MHFSSQKRTFGANGFLKSGENDVYEPETGFYNKYASGVNELEKEIITFPKQEEALRTNAFL